MDWVNFTTKVKMLPSFETNAIANPAATYIPIAFPGGNQIYKITINGVLLDLTIVWRGSRDIPYGIFSLSDSLSISGGAIYSSTLVQAIYVNSPVNNLTPKITIYDDYRRIYNLTYNPDQPIPVGITTANFIAGSQIFDAFNSSADVAYFVFYFKNLADALNAKGANP